MRNVLMIITLSLLVITLVGCSSGMTTKVESNHENEIVDVERLIAHIDDRKEYAVENELEWDWETAEYIPIDLRTFLNNLYTSGEDMENLELPRNIKEFDPIDISSTDYYILDHSINFNSNPNISINFHNDTDKNILFSVTCAKGCDQKYQDLITESLQLEELEYGKDYKIVDQMITDDDSGERYDSFMVRGLE
jgi:hypothetical protein